jgi:hypothetical protein
LPGCAALASVAATFQLAIAANLELLVQFCVGILICSLLLFKPVPGLRLGVHMRCGTSNLFVLHRRTFRRCAVVTDGIFRRRRTKAIPRNRGARRRRVAADPGGAAAGKRYSEQNSDASGYHPTPMRSAKRQLKLQYASACFISVQGREFRGPGLFGTLRPKPPLEASDMPLMCSSIITSIGPPGSFTSNVRKPATSPRKLSIIRWRSVTFDNVQLSLPSGWPPALSSRRPANRGSTNGQCNQHGPWRS